MPSLPRGLYEELITEALEARLQKVCARVAVIASRFTSVGRDMGEKPHTVIASPPSF